MKKAKDYYKADYAVLDTKKMINKGKLLLLSDVSITWVTFRGHWALSYMEVASCHPGVMVVMNKDNSKYFEKLKVTIQVKAQQFPLFPNKLLNCLIVSCCVLLALQVVLLATEMDAVKSENPSECVSEGDTLHSNARHKGMLILQFFFFFLIVAWLPPIWTTVFGLHLVLHALIWPGEEYFHTDLRETEVSESYL